MEENNIDNSESQERRDYAAGSDNQSAGYSSEGRKLRHRRKVNAEPVSEQEASSNYEPRRNYGEGRQNYGDGHFNYGERRPYGDRRPNYGQNRGGYSQNNRGGYGQNRGGYQNRDHGDGSRSGYGDSPRRSYGQRQNDGYRNGGQSYGSRSNYGEGRSNYGDRRSYGDRNSGYGDNRGGYQSRRPYDEGEGGARRSYGRNSYSQGRGNYGPKAGPQARPGRPGRKPVRRNEPHFTAADEAGINQMLASKPQVSDTNALSDNDIVKTPIKEEIRLNKFIANSGVCSRREADNLIQAGVVTVNGEVVTELGTKINILKDEVKYDGQLLKGEPKVYIVMNKPKGFVTSASDAHADKTVMDLIKGCKQRVFPVGRLDKNTTGVLMFTNDGEIAEQLTHPQYNKKKIYQVILDKPLEEADKEKILNEGLDLSDGNIKADELEYIDAEDHRRLGIEIHSGKNRIVRRIFESLGYDVKALDRVYFAGLTKKGLKKGEWRYLSEGEVNILKMGAYV